jgi:S-adenosylmethionine:tRNA-ribosyltransferase-isomerase (queuine synthetase)
MDQLKNLWVFGDSFSVPFKRIENEHPYVPYKGYCPKIFSNIISEKLNFNLMDCSHGGSSNYDIFHNYIKNLDKIKDGDIIIFGWTQVIRFRIASKHNDFYDVIIAVVEHMKDLIDVPSKSLFDITLNRSNNTIYFDELCDYIKIIKQSKPNCKILQWTWVEPLFKDLFENNFYDLLIPYKKYKTVKEETNGDVDDFHYGEHAHAELAEDLLKFL